MTTTEDYSMLLGDYADDVCKRVAALKLHMPDASWSDALRVAQRAGLVLSFSTWERKRAMVEESIREGNRLMLLVPEKEETTTTPAPPAPVVKESRAAIQWTVAEDGQWQEFCKRAEKRTLRNFDEVWKIAKPWVPKGKFLQPCLGSFNEEQKRQLLQAEGLA